MKWLAGWLEILLRTNEMIGWMVWHFISMETNVVLKIYKILIRPHIDYCNQPWTLVSRHGNWSVILWLEAIQRKMTKIIKKCKSYPYKESLDKLGLTTWKSWFIGLVGRVFANGRWDLDSIPGRVIPKTLKNGTWYLLS